MAKRAPKPNFNLLVQELIDAAVREGGAAAAHEKPMKPYYEATHAARDALMDAIEKRTDGVLDKESSDA